MASNVPQKITYVSPLPYKVITRDANAFKSNVMVLNGTNKPTIYCPFCPSTAMVPDNKAILRCPKRHNLEISALSLEKMVEEGFFANCIKQTIGDGPFEFPMVLCNVCYKSRLCYSGNKTSALLGSPYWTCNCEKDRLMVFLPYLFETSQSHALDPETKKTIQELINLVDPDLENFKRINAGSTSTKRAFMQVLTAVNETKDTNAFA